MFSLGPTEIPFAAAAAMMLFSRLAVLATMHWPQHRFHVDPEQAPKHHEAAIKGARTVETSMLWGAGLMATLGSLIVEMLASQASV